MSNVLDKLNSIAGQNNISPEMMNNLFNMFNNSNNNDNKNHSNSFFIFFNK